MASKRAVQLLALRAPQAVATKAAAARFSTQCAAPRRAITKNAARLQTVFVQQRWHSGFPSDKRSKVYEFKDVLSIVENPSDSTLLIDVREPAEFSANSIPTSLNVPIASQPDALLLSDEDFMDRFGWAKPPREKQVVFFCKAGVRSSAAAQLAKQAGYGNVGEYRGSWLDWERNGGPGTKSPPRPGGKGEPSGKEIKE
ncbi:Rhodanese-like protein [Bimuria novae-zelandiae CBS 107.79]|uniref:Rhodanese-like protein n=1 Tax=Bimuria novae-zelandiae CBS 107.79 TaxID=1447943 RepID=A0A6A5V454_9PLEO|nr:Rhodanese-like protein [Bimuria novae-zelandiae CBS 107.79]